MKIEAIKICCHDGKAYYARTDEEVRTFARRYRRIEGRRIKRQFNHPQFLVDHLEVVKMDHRTLGILRRNPEHRRFFEEEE
jgi:recombinational DNA repair ATPase RecF